MLPLKDIEDKVIERTSIAQSIVHAFDHLKRTAIGAKWFAEKFGCDKELQEKAYLSGLLHDVYRPPSDLRHAQTLSKDYDDAVEILKEFNLSDELIAEVTLPIKTHRRWDNTDNILCKCIFLSDKILENMGAMIVFRRNMYLAETTDYVGVELEEAVVTQYEKRLQLYKPEIFPNNFLKLANYQYSWPLNYIESYKKKEEWAIYLNEYCFKKGKENAEFEQMIEEFEPKFEKDSEYKEETLQYLQGSKFKSFERLLL